MALSAGVVGFRGYSGAELVQLLQRHPSARPVLLEHRADSEDRPLPKGHSGPPRLPCTEDAVRSGKLDVVFLATPPEVSMDLAPKMLEAGAKVIDLSGAFRLRTAENYRKWYKEDHTQPDLLAEAAYGLPEFCRSRIAGARLVANPGCYPTAANLAIKPLVEAGILDPHAGVICDAKSGVSGAGRKPSLKTSFCEIIENFSVYSVIDHRHVPEVLLTSGLDEEQFTFTAQLLPVAPRHSRNHLFPHFQTRIGRGSARHLRAPLCQRAVRAPLRTAQAARPRRRRAYEFLRYRISLRRRDRARGSGERDRQSGEGRRRTGRAEHEPRVWTPGNGGPSVKVLVKLGGTLLDEASSRARLAAEIAEASRRTGLHLVVVHGGGKQMTRFLAERGVESRFVNGLRVTTPEVVDAMLKVFAGTVNHQLVASLVGAGARPVGLTGIDSCLTEAVLLDPELGAVGRPVRTDPALLDHLVAGGYLPVVACVAGDREGRIYNVNADQMAASCAAGFSADRLLFLTDVDGVLDKNRSVVPQLTREASFALIADGTATGGMQAKLEAVHAAMEGGVGEIHIAPGSAGVLSRLLDGEAIGTRLVR